MAQMFTRTITTYKATAYTIKWVDGKPEADKLGEAEFVATNASKTEARAALKAAGVHCPRGTEVRIDELESVVYGMSVDEFMQHAYPVERAAKQEQED